MAKQHFYSRVPARISMFNKMDGYDTFARSGELSREFIEKNLLPVCDAKLTKEDAELTVKGVLPVVYCQSFSAEGVMSQSAITFLAADYTGERNSYLVHSLVLDDAERDKCLSSLDMAPFGTKPFKTDLEGFDLTSFEARPIDDLEDIAIKPQKADSVKNLLEKYENGMLKRLIYALAGIACGKVKNLYLGFNTPLKDFSDEALWFMNTVMQIFPFHMRKYLSFITFTSDFSKYNSVKIKCLPEAIANAPTAKGITLKMDTKDYVGISDENVAANALIVDFLFTLLGNEDMRKEFLTFCQHAVQSNEAFAKPTFKNLSDLVYLFKVLSGFFDEKTVLPNDDAAYNFICIYDKNRTSLTDEYRARSMKFLERYPENHTVMPKNIFSKVSSVYPTEIPASKRIVMNVVLTLIHTEGMREKLFAFVKNNYENEDAKTKEEIAENLCRVYYGGFLQKQILEFFSQGFENEPENVRVNIIERLLLTIRTPAIKEQVLQFIEQYYPIFTETEKDKFYTIFYDMLPEGDELSRLLCDIVDQNIDDTRKQQIADKILEIVEADEKHSEPVLCSAIATKCGFCESLLAEKVFGDWSKRKITDEFISAVTKKSIDGLTDTLVEIWTVAPDMNDALKERLFDGVKEAIIYSKSALFDTVNALKKLNELPSLVQNSKDFVERLSQEAYIPNIIRLVPLAFDYKKYPDGLNEIAQFAEQNKAVKDSPEYLCISEYFAGLDCLKSGNVDAVSHFEKIEGKPVRLGAAEHIMRDTADCQLSDEEILLKDIVLSYLKTDEIKFIDTTSKLREKLTAEIYSADGKVDSATAQGEVDAALLQTVITLGGKIYASNISDEQKATMLSASADLSKYISMFANKCDKKQKKAALMFVDTLDAPAQYTEFVKKSFDVKSSGGGLFKRLFK